MNKVVFLFLFLFSSMVFAESFNRLSAFGYSSILFSSDSCRELLLESLQPAPNEKELFVAKIGVQHPGSSKFKLKFFEDSVFSVLLTEKDLFNCSQGACTAIAELPSKKSVKRLKICAFLSSETNKLELFDTSLHGYFRMGEILPENFRVSADNYNPAVNEDVTLTVSVLNTGLNQVNATILNQNKKLEDKKFRIVFGDTTFSGLIKPYQKLSYSFKLRISRPGFIGLPPAILLYSDRFGKQHRVFSNLVSFKVASALPELSAEFDGKNFVKVNEIEKAGIVLKNSSLAEAKNIKLELKPENPDLRLFGPTSFFVASLKPNSFMEKNFSFSSKTSGEKNIRCYLEFVDSGEKKECSSFNIFVKEKQNNLLAPFIILLLLVGVFAYIFIHA